MSTLIVKKESADLRIYHPAHISRYWGYLNGIQRIMLTPSGVKTITEPEKILLVEHLQYPHHCQLNDLVHLQRSHAQWPQTAFFLVSVGPL